MERVYMVILKFKGWYVSEEQQESQFDYKGAWTNIKNNDSKSLVDINDNLICNDYSGTCVINDDDTLSYDFKVNNSTIPQSNSLVSGENHEVIILLIVFLWTVNC